MMNSHKLVALAVAAVTAVTLACSKSPATPIAPSVNPGGVTDANADGSTLKVTAPVPVSPTGGVEITDLDPDLVIENSKPLFVPSLNLSYVFEVIDSEGRLVYRSNPIAQGGSGRTTHEIPNDLEEDERHTWRVRPVLGTHSGPMSTTASFKTFLPGPPGECWKAGAEAAIVACRKEHAGFIHHDELPEFLRAVAFDLNRAGHEWAPYGRLVKETGNNCGGYSCDIICSDAGMHRQWDILMDEDSLQGPVWNRVGEPAVRPCEPVTKW